jgi:M3 family oligoendopeptidase
MRTFSGIQHFDEHFGLLKDVPVEKPDVAKIVAAYGELTKALSEAKSPEEAASVVRDSFVLSDDVSTAFNLVYIRHEMDTKDEYYRSLSDFVDENGPKIQEASNAFDQVLLASPFRKELESTFGSLLFEEIELSNKTFSPAIVEDLVEENKLSSEYVNLISSALITYKGTNYSLSQMGKFLDDPDREVRREASSLVWGYYANHDEEIGRIYDRMIQVRTRMAKKLGYPNYLGLGYARMGRLDWTAEDAKSYRQKILEYIVPVANRIHEAQKKRLGYPDGMHYYDWAMFYKSGNPVPQGGMPELVDDARKMYADMSPIASQYFNQMADHGCLDLMARPGKAGGGFMCWLSGLKTSFIFANSNGTSEDVDTLTHEFGHSLQGFLGGVQEVPNYRSPGAECCEMHSMSMEFLTYPWMEQFFGKAADKYRYQHLCDAITFLPYGDIIDDFQTYCYENPNLTHQERKAYWRKIEKLYLPHLDYEDNAFLASGGFWEHQHHVFENPLYYLDYTIAYIVALEFFLESRKDWKAAFRKYVSFCELGGTLPFRKLLSKAGLANPMDGDTLARVSQGVQDVLSEFDPDKLDV